jgi:hypothetical protein
MKLAQLRNKPLVLLVLKDGVDDGSFSAEFMRKTQDQLSDMSLRIAADHLSVIYADHIKKACEIVLGIINLGLISQCGNNSVKAQHIIQSQGIVYCFRAGWAKYAELKTISAEYFKKIDLSIYALAANDTSDISLVHADLVTNGKKSRTLVEVHNSLSGLYAASAVLPETDEDYLIFELQKLLNSALGLLLLDSSRKIFTSQLYTDLIEYLKREDLSVVQSKINHSAELLKASLPQSTQIFLENMALLEFTEFKKIVAAQQDLSLYMQEILELSVNVSNELLGDFEGGYDFGLDDEDDIAYLQPQ